MWDAVVSRVESATKALTLVRSTEGAQWAINPAVGLRYPLLAIAAAVGDLITSGDVRDVVRLPGPWLRLVVHQPDRPPPLVLDGDLREPGEGSPARRAAPAVVPLW